MRDELERAGRGWAGAPRGPRRMRALAALCDTWVPAVRPPRGAGELGGFWRRTASELDVPLAVAGWLATRVDADDLAGAEQLLDVLGATGFAHLPVPLRAGYLAALGRASAEAAAGLWSLRQLTLLLFYGLRDAEGGNPAWPVLGYPGPPEARRDARPRVEPAATPAGEAPDVLEADVCVVGSGAGGGVVAAALAAGGLDVVVLEAGDAVRTADFSPYEIEALTSLYWGGTYTPSADRNVTLLAGATLGGGTTVNWSNCVPPSARVRAEWATEHGLADVDGATFTAHLDAVLARIGATATCSDRNGPNEALRRGADAHGWSWRVAQRNADPAAYDPATAGHMGYGDRSGSKLSGLRTFLADAVADGARLVTHCRAERILVDGGRAVGVTAARLNPDGAAAPLVVRAGTVVVAGGALESPALLLRSGLGGPVVGHHLRVHPVAALVGYHEQDQRAWWGPPQAVVVDEFAAGGEEGHGFLVECPHYGTGLTAVALPWRSGRDHKLLMGAAGRAATFIGIVRDHGAGRVDVDRAGRSVVTYPVADALDRANLRAALGAMARLHAASGARAILDLEPRRAVWRRGEDLDGWIDRVGGLPVGAGGRSLFSAHQMGSARMGSHPRTSVADPEGQLHDTAGVWIGDTSAFPSAVGANPMVTCMALARRTAHAILAARSS